MFLLIPQIYVEVENLYSNFYPNCSFFFVYMLVHCQMQSRVHSQKQMSINDDLDHEGNLPATFDHHDHVSIAKCSKNIADNMKLIFLLFLVQQIKRIHDELISLVDQTIEQKP